LGVCGYLVVQVVAIVNVLEAEEVLGSREENPGNSVRLVFVAMTRADVLITCTTNEPRTRASSSFRPGMSRHSGAA
jgi:hypothetical protein